VNSTVPLSASEAPPVPERRPGLERVYSDDRLARLASRGNVGAFAVLYERHHQALSSYCRAIVHNEDDAQDALQSAMMHAYAALQTRERDLKVKPWLFRIVHNEAISILRRRSHTTELAHEHDQAGATLEQTVIEREGLATLLEDLGALPERQRAAVVMRELNGLAMQDIAAALSVSRGAAKQMLYEARCALHEFAEGREMDCERVRRSISDGDGRALRARRMRAHMRGCAGCRQFASEIEARTARLQALVPPLPAAWAAAALIKSLAHGTAHAGGAGAGAGFSAGAGTGFSAGAGAGSGGILAGPVGSSLVLKALAGTAVIGAAAAGTAHLVKSPATPARPPAHASPAPTGLAGSGGDSRVAGSAGAPTSPSAAARARRKGAAEQRDAAQLSPNTARGHKPGRDAPGRERADGGARRVRGASPGQAKRSGRTSLPSRGREPKAHAKRPYRSTSNTKANSRRPEVRAVRPGHESQGASTGFRGESNSLSTGAPRRETPALLPTDPTPVVP
jgi:RNA polymerase sigma factor (sigma-70 family)